MKKEKKQKKSKKEKKAKEEEGDEEGMVPMRLYKENVVAEPEPEPQYSMGPYIPEGEREKMAQQFDQQLE